ncbi:MAG: ABC transporter permease [Chitinophagaceae bacterium]|nr:ABC transporter permease [Chitinophagaceae bacterium]
MVSHYFKVVMRSLRKNKGFSFINIIGLAIGMACTLLIFQFVKDELSYDRYHADAGDIHRVVKDFINDDGSRIPDATTPAALAPAMKTDFPEVKHIARILPDWGGSWLIKYGDKKISEEKFWRADSSFFQVFTYPFLKGDPATALKDVQNIVLTHAAAKRYFGSEDPMGKTLNVSPGGDMIVTGVLKDIPANSHFHFDFLVSWKQLPEALNTNWGGYNYYTYIKVNAGTNMPTLTKKIQALYERSQEERYSVFYTQPLTGIHLESNLKWELEPNSDKLYVYVFSFIGFFILLIAAINYINLATAKSSLRAKEIGIRKVSGAIRTSLINQFLLESVITCLIASVLAVLIAQLMTPTVNQITQKQLTIIGDPFVMLYMLAVALLIGLAAGIFPALYLSSFKPIMVLKGFKLNESGALNLRKTLVVVQFTISIVLIIGALIISQQMKFIQSAKLGYNKDQVVVIKNAGFLSRSDRSAFLNEARQLPGVQKAATSTSIIGDKFATTRLRPRGSEKEQQVNFSTVSYEYMDVVGIEMKEGRGFSSSFPADTITNGIPNGPLDQTIGGIVLNETAVRDLGLGTPAAGKQILWGSDGDTTYYLNVVGIAKDWHFTSMRNEIKPFAFLVHPARANNFTVKLSANNIQASLSMLENKWKLFTGERPFEYVFLDETFARLYDSESRFQTLFITLVILGILIACLGLLGLATYAAQQRVKEIGIRKTLGASVTNVVGLLSRDFLKLVVIALVLAIPIGWFAMNKWIQNFAYRTSIEWWVFVVAGLAALFVAFATISIQTIKAASANPVKSLRSE